MFDSRRCRRYVHHMGSKSETPAARRPGRPRKEDVAAQLGTTVSELPDGPADAEGLTPRQRRILEVIRDALAERNYPPSIREIADLVGLASSSSAAHQLKVLQNKGISVP